MLYEYITELEKENQTPYTLTYNGAVSYGAKIGGNRVLAEQHA